MTEKQRLLKIIPKKYHGRIKEVEIDPYADYGECKYYIMLKDNWEWNSADGQFMGFETIQELLEELWASNEVE